MNVSPPKGTMRTRLAALLACAFLGVASCKDGTSPVPVTDLVPPGEPDLIDMSLTIGGSTVVVNKHGGITGQIVLRPGASEVRATFLRFGDVPDPIVTADAFQVEITPNDYSGAVFVRTPGNPFAGTLTMLQPGNFSIRIRLNHYTKGHDDWNTDVSRVYVRY